MSTLRLQDLKQEKCAIDSTYENEGTWFAKAFARHVLCGKVLTEGGLFQDAYLAQHLAAECLLKAMLSAARREIFGSGNNLSAPSQLYFKGLEQLSGSPKKHPLNLEIYGHDLTKLINAVKAVFPELDKGQYTRSFNDFTRSYFHQVKWSQIRYEETNHTPPPGQAKGSWEQAYRSAASKTRKLVIEAMPHLFGEPYGV